MRPADPATTGPTRRSLLRGLAATTLAMPVAAPLLTACGSSASSTGRASTPSASAIPEYFAVDPPMAAPSQTLTQSTGETWHFDNPAKGRLTLLYFGYTSCPDVCPTTMADLAHAMGRLPQDVRDRVWVQMASTDPARDTPHQLSTWLGGFDPTFHGGRAPIAQVVAAARAYGIFIEAPRVTKGTYQVTHGARLLVLDDKGRCVGTFHDLAGARSYEAGIPQLVRAHT